MQFEKGDTVKLRGSETYGIIENIQEEYRPEYGKGKTIIYYVRIGNVLHELVHTEIKKSEK